MATMFSTPRQSAAADNFFRTLAILMALVIVAGFLTQYLAGRSSFASRLLVHAHGLAFMAWVGLFVTQAWLATTGSMTMHRRLGWFGAGWIFVLVVLGIWISVDVTQRGTAPFFFQPQNFLIANPLSVIMFALLSAFAIRFRRKADWHMRLHICAMAAIIGPGFGRLLPMPLLVPYAFELAGIMGLIFPVAGMIRDYRVSGRIHPAWYWGIAAVISVIPISHIIANSPLGDAIYAAVTAGHPGANIPGLAFPPPPPMPG